MKTWQLKYEDHQQKVNSSHMKVLKSCQSLLHK